MIKPRPIVLFVLFLVFVVSFINPVLAKCSAGKGASIFNKDFKILKLQVLEILKQEDSKAFIEIASCDFLVGPPESDNAGFVFPKDISSDVLEVLNRVKWDSKHLDEAQQIRLLSLDRVYELLFRQDDPKKGWYWYGLASADRSLLRKLLAKSHNLPGEQADE